MRKKTGTISVMLLAGLVGMGVAGVIDNAKLYLSFEGDNGNYDSSNEAYWEKVNSEAPSYFGTSGGNPTITNSGIRGDCIDYSAAPAAGSYSTVRYGQIGSDTAFETALIGAQSFTMTGWFNTSGLVANERILDFGNCNLITTSDSRLSFYEDGKTVTDTQSTAIYGADNQWVFFAVTYDGTQSSGNLKYYVGDGATASSLGITKDANFGTLDSASDGMVTYLANRQVNPGDRSFSGYLDELRIYTSSTDASGVLNAASIEEIRQHDISPIPEPTTLGLFAVASGLLMLIRRRMR